MDSNLLEEASKTVDNTPVLINLISKRVRQLSAGSRPMVEVRPRMGLSDVALAEVAAGKLKASQVLL